MFIVPQEVGERKEGQVVVGSLETSEAGDQDYREEQFLYVLDHFVYDISYLVYTNCYKYTRQTIRTYINKDKSNSQV